jgi:superfamily I DNA and/or RNA helicase
VRRLTDDARLLIAGDDRQLPPIVLGAYPDPEEGEPLLHRSIFECLRAADPEHQYTSILVENWRMNETLCRYPREQVYVPSYASSTDEIASRRLALAPAEPGEWVDEILDPAYPLVVCVLEGVAATAENVVEAGLVADCAERLRQHTLDASGSPYPPDPIGDERFWADGLFVVSPHHAQIRAIRRALAERREWHSDPFVDTVDKMQGQECDAVIVSYGVSDVEYALSEKEFIYSLNRLNVAITRARAKTIVFLPLPLLEPPVAAFEDDGIAEGIAFMQGLWQFGEVQGVSDARTVAVNARLLTYRIAAAD